MFRAEITINPVGDYLLAMSILDEGIRGKDSCLDGFSLPSVDCVTETPLDEHVLTPVEVATVLTVFSTLRVITEEEVPCTLGRRCGRSHFVWDSFRVDGTGCGVPRLGEQVRLVMNLLKRLRSGSTDCNANGVDDIMDIATGQSNDTDGDGIPDECPAADFDHDGDVDLADYLVLQAAFRGSGVPTPDPSADLDHDGDVDLADLIAFQAAFTGPQ